MEEAFRSGLFDKPPTKVVKEAHAAKKEDVDLIVRVVCLCAVLSLSFYHLLQVRELEIPRAQAERALLDAEGNVLNALLTLITPKERRAN